MAVPAPLGLETQAPWCKRSLALLASVGPCHAGTMCAAAEIPGASSNGWHKQWRQGGDRQLGAPWGPWQPGGMQELPGPRRRPNLPEFPVDLGAESSAWVGRWSPFIPLCTAACPLALCWYFPALLGQVAPSQQPPCFLPPGRGGAQPLPLFCSWGAEGGWYLWLGWGEMLISCPRL